MLNRTIFLICFIVVIAASIFYFGYKTSDAQSASKQIIIPVKTTVKPYLQCSFSPTQFHFEDIKNASFVISPEPLILHCDTNSPPLTVQFSLSGQPIDWPNTYFAIVESNNSPPALGITGWIPASNFDGHQIQYNKRGVVDIGLYAQINEKNLQSFQDNEAMWNIMIQDEAMQNVMYTFHIKINSNSNNL